MSRSSSDPYGVPSDPGTSSSDRDIPDRIIDDESAVDDAVAAHDQDDTLLADDPLEQSSSTKSVVLALGEGSKLTPPRFSFKRKQKLPSGLSLPKFTSLRIATPGENTTAPQLVSARTRRLREQTSRNTPDQSLPESNGHDYGGPHTSDIKDGGPLDWYAEGPGRRVGYDDLTAIDWIFEYTKERQRLRLLYSRATTLFGYAQQLVDASQVWLVLVATGLASGVLAASIDVASDWLGDLKTGYCKNGAGGGRFYLNKLFCCWGHDGMAFKAPSNIMILTAQSGHNARTGPRGVMLCM